MSGISFKNKSESEMYDIVAATIKRLGYKFRDGNGELNLVGIRGFKDFVVQDVVSCKIWDDIIALVYKTEVGEKKFEYYIASVEPSFINMKGAYNKEKAGDLESGERKWNQYAFLKNGQYKYYLSWHGTGRDSKPVIVEVLKKDGKGRDKKTGKKRVGNPEWWKNVYPALRPIYPDGPGIVCRGVEVDLENGTFITKMDGKEDPKKNYSINIHYGGSRPKFTGGFSHGCQTIPFQEEYNKFINSIKKFKNIKRDWQNDDPTKANPSGTQPIYYTLMGAIDLISSASFPIDLASKGTTPSKEAVKQYYSHTEKEHKGGYYPVGLNSTWHGGVHIYAPKSTDIKAIADGEIVAARLGGEDVAKNAYGSNNFILLKHEFEVKTDKNKRKKGVLYNGKNVVNSSPKKGTNTTKDIINYYSLYYHLSYEEGYHLNWKKREKEKEKEREKERRKEEEKKKIIVWVFRSQLPVYNKTNGTYYPLTQPIDYAYQDYPMKDDYLQRKVGKPQVAVNFKKGDILKYIDKRGKYRKVRLEKSATLEEKKNEAVYGDWLYKYIKEKKFKEWSDAWQKGEVAQGMKVQVNAGDVLWKIGEAKGDFMLHWEVFSEELIKIPQKTNHTGQIPIEWTIKKDTNDDFNCDCKDIIELVDEPGLFGKAADGILDKDELINFYSDTEKCKKFRNYACWFISEFAVDWDKAVEKMKGKFWTSGLSEKLKPYNFWDDIKEEGLRKKIWHYNPIAFIENILCDFSVEAPKVDEVKKETKKSEEKVCIWVLRADLGNWKKIGGKHYYTLTKPLEYGYRDRPVGAALLSRSGLVKIFVNYQKGDVLILDESHIKTLRYRKVRLFKSNSTNNNPVDKLNDSNSDILNNIMLP